MNQMTLIGVSTFLILCFCPITYSKGYYISCNTANKFCLFSETTPLNFTALKEYNDTCKKAMGKSRTADARPALKTYVELFAKYLHYSHVILNARLGRIEWEYANDGTKIEFEESFVVQGNILLYKIDSTSSEDIQINLICIVDCASIYDQRDGIGVKNWPSIESTDSMEVVRGSQLMCKAQCDKIHTCQGLETNTNNLGKCILFMRDGIDLVPSPKSKYFKKNVTSATKETCLDEKIVKAQLIEKPKKPIYKTARTTAKKITTAARPKSAGIKVTTKTTKTVKGITTTAINKADTKSTVKATITATAAGSATKIIEMIPTIGQSGHMKPTEANDDTVSSEDELIDGTGSTLITEIGTFEDAGNMSINNISNKDTSHNVDAANIKSKEPWVTYLIACFIAMVLIMIIYGLTRKEESSSEE